MARKNATIAIIDDEEAYRRALSRLLRAKGHRVVDFSNGTEFIAQSSPSSFDCVLLDLYMPGMSGLDVLAELSRNPKSPPVIVVTAHDEQDLIERARTLKVFECHSKPIGAAALLDAIDRALRR